MREVDWVAHRRHRAQVAEDMGRWLGLLDEDWVPMMDLPQETSMSWPTTRGSVDSIEVTVPVRTPTGGVHAVVDELVAEHLGVVDAATGKLVPVTGPARFLAIERPGGPRRMARVTHVVADGDAEAPHTLTIHAVSENSYLELLPCPSSPTTWAKTFTRFDRDWVGDETKRNLFDKPRDLAPMRMIVVADGATVHGPADEVIYRLVSESVEAVCRVAGIKEDPPYVVVRVPAAHAAGELFLRPTDQTIWQEISDACMSAGVSVVSSLWWPGDDPVPDKALQLPTLVFTVKQEGA